MNSKTNNMAYQHPAMKTTGELLARYGNPFTDQKAFEDKWMVLYILPEKIHKAINALPLHIYMNKDITDLFEFVLNELITAGLHTEIRTFDGCFNVRRQRGSSLISRHSWGVALDLNAGWNKLHKPSTWTEGFLNVWRNAGWICGADFHTRKDPMHYELTAATAW